LTSIGALCDAQLERNGLRTDMTVKILAIFGTALFACIVTWVLTIHWNCPFAPAPFGSGQPPKALPCTNLLGGKPWSKDAAGELTAGIAFFAAIAGWFAADFGAKR
jgi:hypothetical protein